MTHAARGQVRLCNDGDWSVPPSAAVAARSRSALHKTVPVPFARPRRLAKGWPSPTIFPFDSSVAASPGIAAPKREWGFPPMTPTAIVAYLALFATVGFLFVLAASCWGKCCVLASAHSPKDGDLRVRRAGRRARLGAVRFAVLRGGAGVSDFRGGGGLFLSAGYRLWPSHPLTCRRAEVRRRAAAVTASEQAG